MISTIEIPSKQEILENPSVLINLLDQHFDTLKSHSVFDSEDILAIRLYDNQLNTVAHELVREDQDYLLTNFVDNYRVLKLANLRSWTIAHHLALNGDEKWMISKAAHDVDILTLEADHMGSVAYQMIKHKGVLNNDTIFDKRVLTQVYFEKTLALHLHQLYPDDERVSIENLMQTLIKQGAAYKHNMPVSVTVGPQIIQFTKDLICENSEPKLNLKYCLAAYSTAYHCSNYPTFPNASFHAKWSSTLSEIEEITKNLLVSNPELMNSIPDPDYFCEPSQFMINHLFSKLTLEKGVQSLEGIDETHSNEIEAFKIY